MYKNETTFSEKHSSITYMFRYQWNAIQVVCATLRQSKTKPKYHMCAQKRSLYPVHCG